jgi:beta-mannanase
VVERFRRAGATRVIWVWSPHLAHAGIEQYYPGDDVVDWVGTGALNYGAVAYWSQWWSFAEIFGAKYQGLASLGKPIMIAEFGSLAVGGDRRQWYEAALVGLGRDYPAVRALLFFNAAHDQTVTQQALDWTLTRDSLTLAGVREQLQRLVPR